MTLIASTWEPIAASVVGRAHQRARRGSQDALALRVGEDWAVAVVCDGCSAGEASEIGAGLGARFVAADLARRLEAGADADDDVAEAVVGALVEELCRVAWTLSVTKDDVTQTLASCLLFTVQAAVIKGDRFCVFGVGDGVVRVDGADVVVAAAADGAPDCPAYRLVPGLEEHARLVVHARGDARSLSSLTVATDGALELARRVDEVLPSGERFGGLALLERDARFAKNPTLAAKRIASLGAAAPEDDCSFVCLRRPRVVDVNEVLSCA